MTDTVFLPLTSCGDCPHLKTEPDYTADSFERPEKWICRKSNCRIVARYVEWHDKVAIPGWCPLRRK